MSVMPSISLVNVSNNEKHSIDSTECVIGRGWLQCDDKRISRNHGILKVISPNSVAVISTHQNSMFFRKKNDAEVSQIEENDQVNLFIGDSFGLLVDAFWFSIQASSDENDVMEQSNASAIQSIAIASSSNGIKRKPSSESQPDSTNKKVKTEPNEFQDDDEANADLTTHISIANEPSTSTNVSGNIPPTEVQNVAPVTIKSEPMDPDSVPVVVKTEPASENGNVDSTDELVPVPIKTEVKEEPPNNDNDGATTSSGNVERTQRECCRYGMRCYRRNPIHRAEQAHPGDNDYRMPEYPDPPLGVPPCPYLDRCYRRNPQHFRQFSHKTPLGKEGYEATARPPTSGSTTQTTATDDDSDEDPYATDGDSDEEFEPQDTSDDEDVFGGNTD